MPSARTLALEVIGSIDSVTTFVGHTIRWLTLAIPLVCFGYAVARKVLPWGHNGFSELQWYLFAAVYLLAAGYTLMRNEHVRVDFFWRTYSASTKCSVDLAYLVALMVVCVHLSAGYWNFWIVSATQREGPEDVLIGLERWPIKLALCLGFGLLALQCLSEALKRIAVLKRWIAPDAVYESMRAASSTDSSRPKAVS